MNQIFNIKRFCRYVAGYLRHNLWFLAIMALIFMVPATIVSVLQNPQPAVVMSMFAIGVTMVAQRSNSPDSTMRHLVPESSVAEKFITETLIKMAFVGIPFAIHAAMQPTITLQTLFADGFNADYLLLLWLIMWTITVNVTMDYKIKRTNNTFRKMACGFYSMELTFFILMVANFATNALDVVPHYSLWVKILLLAVGTALLVLSYYLFNRRYVDYNKDE